MSFLGKYLVYRCCLGYILSPYGYVLWVNIFKYSKGYTIFNFNIPKVSPKLKAISFDTPVKSFSGAKNFHVFWEKTLRCQDGVNFERSDNYAATPILYLHYKREFTLQKRKVWGSF